ncbi:MAG TPA: hypothetical protein VHU89_13050 [Acidobacteriaceae bacterium]|jgi:hypothetical protein|nr:hypothetical protein [Acidobacteriaceae bacterium]
MTQPLKNADEFPRDADEARRARERYEREAPTESPTHGMERAPRETLGVDVQPEPPRTSLNEDIRARIEHPHKGDVGRPGTNEEIFQGSKQRELK